MCMYACVLMHGQKSETIYTALITPIVITPRKDTHLVFSVLLLSCTVKEGGHDLLL